MEVLAPVLETLAAAGRGEHGREERTSGGGGEWRMRWEQIFSI
jgi:hypothetical protein